MKRKESPYARAFNKKMNRTAKNTQEQDTSQSPLQMNNQDDGKNRSLGKALGGGDNNRNNRTAFDKAHGGGDKDKKQKKEKKDEKKERRIQQNHIMNALMCNERADRRAGNGGGGDKLDGKKSGNKADGKKALDKAKSLKKKLRNARKNAVPSKVSGAGGRKNRWKFDMLKDWKKELSAKQKGKEEEEEEEEEDEEELTEEDEQFELNSIMGRSGGDMDVGGGGGFAYINAGISRSRRLKRQGSARRNNDSGTVKKYNDKTSAKAKAKGASKSAAQNKVQSSGKANKSEKMKKETEKVSQKMRAAKMDSAAKMAALGSLKVGMKANDKDSKKEDRPKEKKNAADADMDKSIGGIDGGVLGLVGIMGEELGLNKQNDQVQGKRDELKAKKNKEDSVKVDKLVRSIEMHLPGRKKKTVSKDGKSSISKKNSGAEKKSERLLQKVEGIKQKKKDGKRASKKGKNDPITQDLQSDIAQLETMHNEAQEIAKEAKKEREEQLKEEKTKAIKEKEEKIRRLQRQSRLESRKLEIVMQAAQLRQEEEDRLKKEKYDRGDSGGNGGSDDDDLEMQQRIEKLLERIRRRRQARLEAKERRKRGKRERIRQHINGASEDLLETGTDDPEEDIDPEEDDPSTFENSVRNFMAMLGRVNAFIAVLYLLKGSIDPLYVDEVRRMTIELCDTLEFIKSMEELVQSDIIREIQGQNRLLREKYGARKTQTDGERAPESIWDDADDIQDGRAVSAKEPRPAAPPVYGQAIIYTYNALTDVMKHNLEVLRAFEYEHGALTEKERHRAIDSAMMRALGVVREDGDTAEDVRRKIEEALRQKLRVRYTTHKGSGLQRALEQLTAVLPEEKRKRWRIQRGPESVLTSPEEQREYRMKILQENEVLRSKREEYQERTGREHGSMSVDCIRDEVQRFTEHRADRFGAALQRELEKKKG